MIDLHTHTDESDGTYSPAELVNAAIGAGLNTLAITDHDTFAGYEKAAPIARDAGLNLIRAIELNTRHLGRNIHLLGYFPDGPPSPALLERLRDITDSRKERNRQLIARLQSLGVDITMEDVEAVGRSLTGRPHFARVLVEKGYAANRDEAFHKFLGENGQAYIERESPGLEEAIGLITGSGGTASLAHPIRLGKRNHVEEERFIAGLKSTGLPSIEVFHTDHTAADIERYRTIAAKYGYGYTGGSDFHGDYKPHAKLGHATNGTTPIPDSALEAVRALSR
jgi:3',5'-nucleoside bisphosphate phosphatase